MKRCSPELRRFTAQLQQKERNFIMTDKMYPIQNGDVTLYVQMSYNGTQFDYKGFTVEGDGNLYMPGLTDYNHIDLDGRPCVDIGDYLFDMYKALADAQSRKYLERHIHDAIDPLTFKCFWHQAGQPLSFRYYKKLREEQVIDGLVGIEIERTICYYNFVANESAGYRALYHDKKLATTPMKVFYGDYMAQLLALEQQKRGLAPPVYAELARLNAFLEGKKSVKLVMKDGAVFELKSRYTGDDITLSTLLDYSPGAAAPFFLNDSYQMKPRFGCNCPLADLDYIQYGKQKFVIDVEALGRFKREEADAI